MPPLSSCRRARVKGKSPFLPVLLVVADFWDARIRSLGPARSGRRTTSLQNSSKHVPRSQDYSGNTIPRLIDLSMAVHQAPPGAGVSDVMTLGKIKFGILIFSSLAATGATLAGGISKNLAISKN